MKHSTCSHKWWETLKGSVFGAKPSIPALRGPGDGLVVAPPEKVSLLALSLTASSVMSSFSHLCLVSLILGAIVAAVLCQRLSQVIILDWGSPVGGSTTNNYANTRVLSQCLLLPAHTIGNEIGVPGYQLMSCMVRDSRIRLDYAMAMSLLE